MNKFEKNAQNTYKNDIFFSLVLCFYIVYCIFEVYLNSFVGEIGKYVVLLLVMELIRKNVKLRLKWFHIALVLWVFLKVVSIFWVEDVYIVKLHFMSQFLMVIFFVIITASQFNEKDIQLIWNSLLYSSGVYGLLSIFLSQSYHGTVDSRQVLTLFNTQIDPNNQAALLLIGCSLSLYYIFNNKFKLYKSSVLIILFSINAISILMTGSRGGLLSLIFIIFVCIITAKTNNHGWLLIMYRFAFALTIGLLFSNFVTFLIPSETYHRLFVISGYNGGSTRTELWTNVLGLVKNHLIFGSGWGSYWGYNGHYSAVHNTFLSILSDGGIVGLVLFCFPIFDIIYVSIKKHTPAALIILVTGILPAMFFDAINKRFFWNAIIFAIIINQLDENKKQKEGNI